MVCFYFMHICGVDQKPGRNSILGAQPCQLKHLAEALAEDLAAEPLAVAILSVSALNSSWQFSC